jgi:hypothetical protein
MDAKHRLTKTDTHSRVLLHLHIENTGSQPLASAFFKLPNLVCACSESPQSALHVEICMAQHLLLSALGVEGHSRPFAAIGYHLKMLQRGPSLRFSVCG